jgi:hypothetical protein
MCILVLAEKNLKFAVVESLNTSNGVFYLVEKKKKEREERRRDLDAG